MKAEQWILLIPAVLFFVMSSSFTLAKSYAAAVWSFGAGLCSLAIFLKIP